MQNRRQDGVRRERLDRMKRIVADHIAHVCSNFSPAEFDALVTRIAEIEIKYSMRERHDFFDSMAAGTSRVGPPSDRV